MPRTWKDDKCPGSGQLPRRVHQFGTDEEVWEMGDCPVCGRPWFNLTKAGRFVHTREKMSYRGIDLIISTLRSAHDLIDSALKAVGKLDPDYLCTMNAECPESLEGAIELSNVRGVLATRAESVARVDLE